MGQAGWANIPPQSSQLKNASAACWRPSTDSSDGPERPEFGHSRPSRRRSGGHCRIASDFFNTLARYPQAINTAPLGVTAERVEVAGGAREPAGWREEPLEGTAHAGEGHAPRRASPGDDPAGNVGPSEAWTPCARRRSR